MAPPDRLELLVGQVALTGIDFVAVDKPQTTLTVHFLVPPTKLIPRATPFAPNPTTIAIRSRAPDADVTEVAVQTASLVGDQLVVTVVKPIGFAPYTFHIESEYLDPYFNDAHFSFKVHCDSELDCRVDPPECPPDPGVDFPIDYLARDFSSLRNALLAFAAQRHPEWSNRVEADVGMMLLEAMSALGDEHAFYQDRVAREAYLETATQRRSLRRHARLVDYDVDDGTGATTWLDVTVDASATAPIALVPGTVASAIADDRTTIAFEIGAGVRDTRTYWVAPDWNSWLPYFWSDDVTCLPRGSTSIDIAGDRAAALTPSVGLDAVRLLLRVDPPTPDVPQRRCVVTVASFEVENDPLLGQSVTRVHFVEPLEFELDREATTIGRNVVPATAGVTHRQTFTIPAAGDISPGVVERVGPNGTTTFLFSLDGSDTSELVRLAQRDGGVRPEITLEGAAVPWEQRDSFVGAPSAAPDEAVFVLDDGMWRRIVHFDRPEGRIDHYDYASGAGKTIRFGDGALGSTPARGTTFTLAYRLGGGSVGNVAAETIRQLATPIPFVTAITNPMPVVDGRDPETAQTFKQLAPEAFRAVAYRAVKPEDYAEALERLAWVQRAGATFRWTGSWITAFATPDPRQTTKLSAARRADANRQLDAFRQAGREAFVSAPRYADLDLKITVCVEASAYSAHVQVAVMRALVGRNGFFSPDRFTFGTSLRKTNLEAAIQAVSGVRAVEIIEYRRRGWFDWKELTSSYSPGMDTVIRVENDAMHPERGTIELEMEGGA
ncbi:putative baseplate assembly protein [soil metagenome]